MKLGVSALGARRGKSGGRLRRGEALGCSRCLFTGQGGEVMGRGRQDGDSHWAASMVTVFGIGGTQVPIDEGNGGGMGGASL
jgi:hypothetical protein